MEDVDDSDVLHGRVRGRVRCGKLLKFAVALPKQVGMVPKPNDNTYMCG